MLDYSIAGAVKCWSVILLMVCDGRKIAVGDPRDSGTWMGPLISKQHEEKVRGYLKIAKDEGLKFCCGETVDQLALSAANQNVTSSHVCCGVIRI